MRLEYKYHIDETYIYIHIYYIYILYKHIIYIIIYYIHMIYIYIYIYVLCIHIIYIYIYYVCFIYLVCQMSCLWWILLSDLKPKDLSRFRIGAILGLKVRGCGNDNILLTLHCLGVSLFLGKHITPHRFLTLFWKSRLHEHPFIPSFDPNRNAEAVEISTWYLGPSHVQSPKAQIKDLLSRTVPWQPQGVMANFGRKW